MKTGSYIAQILGSALLLALLMVGIDALMDNSFSPGASALKGAVLGAAFGIVERPLRRLLSARDRD